MAAQEDVETLTARMVKPVNEDWLDSCAFTPRHDPLSRNTATPIQKFEKTAPTMLQPLRPERVVFPVLDRRLETITKSLSTRKPSAPSKSSPPPEKTQQLPNALAAELHSFRQLSSPLFCPETSMDTLPEYILFGLIVLLAVVWPILAMLGVMSRA